MSIDVSKLAPYAKAVVAVGGFVLVVAKAVADGVLTVDDLQAIGVAAGVAFGVWLVPNKKA